MPELVEGATEHRTLEGFLHDFLATLVDVTNAFHNSLPWLDAHQTAHKIDCFFVVEQSPRCELYVTQLRETKEYTAGQCKASIVRVCEEVQRDMKFLEKRHIRRDDFLRFRVQEFFRYAQREERETLENFLAAPIARGSLNVFDTKVADWHLQGGVDLGFMGFDGEDYVFSTQGGLMSGEDVVPDARRFLKESRLYTLRTSRVLTRRLLFRRDRLPVPLRSVPLDIDISMFPQAQKVEYFVGHDQTIYDRFLDYLLSTDVRRLMTYIASVNQLGITNLALERAGIDPDMYPAMIQAVRGKHTLLAALGNPAGTDDPSLSATQ